MKILQVAPCLNSSWGGSAAVVRDISKQLAKRGHEVTIYTSDGTAKGRLQNIDGVKVFFLPTLNSWNAIQSKFFITPKLNELVKREIQLFDLIHLHEFRSYQNLVVHHYATKFKVPYVMLAHNSLPRVPTKRRLKWVFDVFFGYRILKDVSRVIALSGKEAKQYINLGVPESKILSMPNGIDLSKYFSLPPRGSFKSKFNIDEKTKVILSLGRINKEKGLDFLIKAYAALIKEPKYSRTLLVISGRDDGFTQVVMSLVDSLGLTNKVILTGFLSEEDKIKAYVDSEVVINVEPENIFGLVPLEAAASSTPVIVCKTNDISEVVLAGNLGCVVEYNNIPELTQTMAKLLDQSSSLTLIQRQKRRSYIFNNFDWNVVMPQLEKIYEITVANSKHGVGFSKIYSLN